MKTIILFLLFYLSYSFLPAFPQNIEQLKSISINVVIPAKFDYSKTTTWNKGVKSDGNNIEKSEENDMPEYVKFNAVNIDQFSINGTTLKGTWKSDDFFVYYDDYISFDAVLSKDHKKIKSISIQRTNFGHEPMDPAANHSVLRQTVKLGNLVYNSMFKNFTFDTKKSKIVEVTSEYREFGTSSHNTYETVQSLTSVNNSEPSYITISVSYNNNSYKPVSVRSLSVSGDWAPLVLFITDFSKKHPETKVYDQSKKTNENLEVEKMLEESGLIDPNLSPGIGNKVPSATDVVVDFSRVSTDKEDLSVKVSIKTLGGKEKALDYNIKASDYKYYSEDAQSIILNKILSVIPAVIKETELILAN